MCRLAIYLHITAPRRQLRSLRIQALTVALNDAGRLELTSTTMVRIPWSIPRYRVLPVMDTRIATVTFIGGTSAGNRGTIFRLRISRMATVGSAKCQSLRADPLCASRPAYVSEHYTVRLPIRGVEAPPALNDSPVSEEWVGQIPGFTPARSGGPQIGEAPTCSVPPDRIMFRNTTEVSWQFGAVESRVSA